MVTWGSMMTCDDAMARDYIRARMMLIKWMSYRHHNLRTLTNITRNVFYGNRAECNSQGEDRASDYRGKCIFRTILPQRIAFRTVIFEWAFDYRGKNVFRTILPHWIAFRKNLAKHVCRTTRIRWIASRTSPPKNASRTNLANIIRPTSFSEKQYIQGKRPEKCL